MLDGKEANLYKIQNERKITNRAKNMIHAKNHLSNQATDEQQPSTAAWCFYANANR